MLSREKAQDVRGWVLVVEDDDLIRESIVLTLEEEGYEVVGAQDGAAGIEYLDDIRRNGRRQPALILLDMLMPRMDGWAFLRAYRALPVPHARVVIVTAAPDAAQRAAQMQADGVIAKPFDLDDLLGVVAQHLARSVA